MRIGYVNALETFGLVDGPGVRFVVFLQGCNMRCRYCHNPETWALSGGEEWTAVKLYDHVKRYKPYWKNNGGITVSGGEPLLQMEFVTEFFELAKQDGVHTAIDTSGQPFCESAAFEKLMEVTDLVLLDIKEWDSDKHKALTGFGNENILAMARWLSEHGKKMWIRHVLVPNLTDDSASLQAIHDFIATLNGVERVEILPYHTFGIAKWQQLGLTYPLEGVLPPTAEQIELAKKITV